MKTIRKLPASIASSALAVAISVAALPVQAISLSDTPLFLSTAVDPNVFFEVDDSGSMDWEITTSSQWHYCGYSTDNCGWFVTDGIWLAHTGNNWRWFYYIFNNTDNAYSIGCNGNLGALYSCNATMTSNTPYQNDWRILSPDFNVTYYDPRITYTPWRGPCDAAGTPCANASFTAARSNPRVGEAGYTSTRNLNGFTFEIWEDTRGFTASDNRPRAGNNINANNTPNGLIDVWDKHTRHTISGANLLRTEVTYNPTSTGLNPTSTALATISGTGQVCYSNGTICRTVDQEKQNVANWYQYYRKRSYVAKAAIAAVISDNPDFRYGLSVINNFDDLFVQVPGSTVSNYGSHNTNLLGSLFAYNWEGLGTPLRTALQRTGQYYDNALGDDYDDPIINTCQKNFTVLFTDGYWNGNNPGVGNVDGDGHSDTLADVAKFYYDRDLSPFPNEVSPDPDGFDTATHQHMVTFGVAFGVDGQLVDTDNDGWPNPVLTEPSDWGNPHTSNPGKIDDLWHAAWNSRGTYVSAKTPSALISALQNALQVISNRSKTASSVALSTGHLSSDTRLYQAQFVPTDWHGKLLSIPIGSGGVLGSSTTDAGQRLPAANDRVIITLNSQTNAGVPFRWGNISPAQQASLNNNMAGSPDGLGNQRLNYLRGDAANENNSTGFRERPVSKLGDIINSPPTFVGAPGFRYPDSWGTGAPETSYSVFKSSKSGRTPMIYVGANDGMLHAFKADGNSLTDLLVEKLAYVPKSIYSRLSALTSRDYSHKYYVDGTPTVIDAFFSGNWHTMLVSGLNKGGQAYFALDVTDPSTFSESGTAPDDIVLWEFNDSNDADLGYTYGQPSIVRMHNGRWAVIVGNGYNNTDTDGSVSTTGRAYLYILDAETGAVIKELDTRVGSTTDPNGMSTPTAVDINSDYIVDYIYAGDLRGNMWKFDVQSSNTNQWDFAFKSGNNPRPLFTATDNSGTAQSIISKPTVGSGPFGPDLMVYFGTGKYLGNSDLSDTSQHTFYGILDRDARVTSKNNLVEQSLTYTSGNYGVISNNQIEKTHDGWFIHYPDTGERSLGNPILRGGRIIFVTVVPDGNACSEGGVGYLWELDARNGGALQEPPFDINGDGIFDEQDMIDTDGDGVRDTSPGRKRSSEGVIPTPAVLMDENKEYKFTPGSSGNVETTVENPGSGNLGRQSWRQLR